MFQWLISMKCILFKDNFEDEISNEIMSNNMMKMMKLMIPFIPHLAHECLELLKCKKLGEWPEIDRKNILDEISLAVQINGKTKDVIKIKRDLDKKSIDRIIQEKIKGKKAFSTKKIIKTIFVKIK